MVGAASWPLTFFNMADNYCGTPCFLLNVTDFCEVTFIGN